MVGSRDGSLEGDDVDTESAAPLKPLISPSVGKWVASGLRVGFGDVGLGVGFKVAAGVRVG